MPTRSERSDWPQDQFLAWLDATKRHLGISSDNQLAIHLGIGHTLISGWRNGRQRPSVETLSHVATVLGEDARRLWVLAGLVTPLAVGLLDEGQPLRPADPAEITELRELLADPRLGDAARDQLLGTVRVLVAGTRASLPEAPPTGAGGNRRRRTA